MSKSRFLQTKFWADFKALHGWTSYFFTLKNGTFVLESNFLKNTLSENCFNEKNQNLEEKNLSVLVRSFSVKVKKFSLAYIPMAPEFLDNQSTENYLLEIKKISEQIKNFLPKDTIYIRFDLPIDFETLGNRDSFTKELLSLAKKNSFNLKKSKVSIQPPDTTILNLRQSEDKILSNMKSKWRYNIRLAKKKNVEIIRLDYSSPNFETYFDEFYKLFKTTSERDKVSFHNKSYYLDLFKQNELTQEKSKENPKIYLYLAKHENDYLAGIITLFCEKEAVYLYGASGNLKRNLMPSYLLQWTAIQDAKKFNCPVYDFYGMPPNDDKSHPMHGLYLFKTGFGGKIIHRPGSFDAVLKPCFYKIYSLAEKFRAFYFKILRKKI